MKKVSRLQVSFRGREVGELALSPEGYSCIFEYAPEWIRDGFSISPLELPLKTGIFIAKPMPFDGNFGVFEDSMPDGYGRYLLRKTLLKIGINDKELSSLDRLSIVGENGMGGLSYTPVWDMKREDEVTDFDLLQKKALEVLKEQQDEDAGLLLYNSGNSGGARPKAIFSDNEGHWLVKFRHTYDPESIGGDEYLCNELARNCGVTIPDFKLVNNKYFTSKRFDISPTGERIHTATAGALLGVSHRAPILDYANLLALTGFITQSEEDVEEMFRRMIFNYRIGNMDDHSKNFSYIVVEESDGRWRWRLAPAYDLTSCDGGYNGQHATSVNGKGTPAIDDFIAVGIGIGMSESTCRQIISQIDKAMSVN